MTTIKALLGGLLGFLLLAISSVGASILTHRHDRVVGWDPISLLHRPFFWILVLLFFGIGAFLASN